MEGKHINVIATVIVAFSTSLATLGAISYYFISLFDLKGIQISLVGEIYILLNLLIVDWIKRLIK